MSRAERVLWLVNELHRLDAEREGWDEYPYLLGWIESSVKPDNGRSDMQARAEAQEAFEALNRFQRERAEARAAQRAQLVDQEVVTGFTTFARPEPPEAWPDADGPSEDAIGESAALIGSQQQLVDEALAEPLAQLAVVQGAAEAAGFEREDPVTGEPLPDGVAGFPAGGRR